MSREIKFRAWDVQEKCWIPEELICISAGGMIITWQELEKRWIEETIRLVICQYTGLKDKNGVEIYEGDIVIADDNGEYFPEVYNDAKDEYLPCGKYKVVWECDYPAFDLRTLDGKRLDLEFNPFTGEAEFEVIGNIYENPEIMEAKDE